MRKVLSIIAALIGVATVGGFAGGPRQASTGVPTALAVNPSVTAVLPPVSAALLATAVPPGTDRPSGPLDRASCTECHTEVLDHRAVHGPVGVNACDACHEPVSEAEHTYRIARQGAELCTFCHDVQVQGAAVVHEPLLTGDCLSCHDPHGGTDRMMLGAATSSTLCNQCHEDVVAGRRSVHGPVAAGACVACHTAHSSPHPGLLRSSGADVCTSCHAATKTQMESMRVVHDPARQDCQTCHDPHASDHMMMLKMEPEALCMKCHEAVQHMVENATTQHAAVTTERGCLNCHDAHASDHPAILQQDMMTLCFECHDREIELEDGATIADIKAVIDTGTSLHGPIAQNNCAACHQIHGGDHFRLLVKEYPPEFYAPFEEESYALCFSCHDPQLVRDQRTTALTNFRNGNLNLHFLHVNRDKKGRTCRACHETHASVRSKHIRESVPFGSGGWMLPINFEPLDTGGSCAPGCHVPYTYDRVDPVTYGAPAQAVWPGEQPQAPRDRGAAGTAPGGLP